MTMSGALSQLVVVPVRLDTADDATVLVTSLDTHVIASTSVCGSFAGSGCRSGRPMNACSTFKLASRPMATAMRSDFLPHSCEVSACKPLSKLSDGSPSESITKTGGMLHGGNAVERISSDTTVIARPIDVPPPALRLNHSNSASGTGFAKAAPSENAHRWTKTSRVGLALTASRRSGMAWRIAVFNVAIFSPFIEPDRSTIQ